MQYAKKLLSQQRSSWYLDDYIKVGLYELGPIFMVEVAEMKEKEIQQPVYFEGDSQVRLVSFEATRTVLDSLYFRDLPSAQNAFNAEVDYHKCSK